MKWHKHGLVFDPTGKIDWAISHALQPTPLVLPDRIRVFVGLRDAIGVSRIGFVDLQKDDPTRVMGYSQTPVLDIGEDGCFDENGVVPSAVVQQGSRVYLYYAGYQLGAKVRFLAFGGLAISDDFGQTFKRYQKVPVFERTNAETLFRVPHTVLYRDGIWKAWYGGGSHYIAGAVKTLPVYNVRYTESDNPYFFGEMGKVVLDVAGSEHRVGRPFVFSRGENDHYLFYGYGTEHEPYQLGFARSSDMINWKRHDQEIGLGAAADGWDSQMIAYPSVVQIGEKIYIFYNGRNYGAEGFGLAELLEW
ncbi:glycosylase [Brucella endophytica]|uniref:Glycosylase n=1 Tax=Brucella endophytica TaxID=1963359 RepID=A0A916S947_9HYPH|nr:hypothetical protein [Brucella endophytica]GGA86901.1 glycosylase [Brucella endophytica]